MPLPRAFFGQNRRFPRRFPDPGTARQRLLVGDPAAVEAERDAGRQVNPGDWFAAEVLCREDHQVGGGAVGVVHEGHDVTIVLGGVRRGRHEDRLAGGGIAAELMRLRCASGQVVLDQGIAECTVGEVSCQGDDLAR